MLSNTPSPEELHATVPPACEAPDTWNPVSEAHNEDPVPAFAIGDATNVICISLLTGGHVPDVTVIVRVIKPASVGPKL